MKIRDATSSGDFEAAAALMRAFIQWHYARHARDRHVIDSYFEPAAFEAELGALPGPYAPPAGALLVAEDRDRIIGCVALRPLSDGTCEMKRMFVDPEWHRTGAGQRLAQAVIERARALGYTRMLLDTGPAQKEAQGLYRKLGFREIPPYYDLPPLLRDWLVFMALDLTWPTAARR